MARQSKLNLSEAFTQTLFAMYAHEYARCLGKRFLIFSPTQPQEAELGYDAALRGSACRELYLQFKCAEPSEKKTIQELHYKVENKRPTKLSGRLGQLATLQKRYPKGSAFYVCGCFRNVAHALKMQQRTRRARTFLDIYTALSAHEIHVAKQSRTICMHYAPPLFSNLARIFPARGKEYMYAEQWFYGSELLHQFLTANQHTADVGCTIETRNGQLVRVPNRAASDQGAEEIRIPPEGDDSQDDYSLHRLTIRVFDEAQA